MPVPVTVEVSDVEINPLDMAIWDFAGVDGLQTAIALFSAAVSQLAPFQSVTTRFNQQPCSVLRLCENNFRVVLSDDTGFSQAVASLESKVWVSPSPTANLRLPATRGIERLAQIATTKPVYRLDPFPCDRAVPARIDGAAIVAWHLPWQGQPRLLIQAAAADLRTVQAAFTGTA
ncbi:hypothetical protein C7271_18995 [filamentous cyanobacterium CCP5]|nr:hypothetical protein C7271_18995 [filamentous cyanobacterium CCP5]